MHFKKRQNLNSIVLTASVLCLNQEEEQQNCIASVGLHCKNKGPDRK